MTADQGTTERTKRGATARQRGIEVEAAGHRYPVLIGRGLLAELPGLLDPAQGRRCAVISDETVGALYGAEVTSRLAASGRRASLFTFPAGESSKNRAEWARLTDALLDDGCGRDTLIVAVGGGVTGDLAGFVAATFMRGVPLVQVPTSLLAMVDASVGGKTGVDAPAGKNLVGAFHPPVMVITDPAVISTLPRWARADGLVEAVKHGAILDATYLATVEADLDAVLAGDAGAIERVVRGSVRLKSAVVGDDELEAGRRQVLNFGHTLGHGVEAASDFRIRHGQAVALGMVLEAALGERLGITEPGAAARLVEISRRLDMPTRMPTDLDPETVMRFVARDKKARRGAPRFVLLQKMGSVSPGELWTHAVPESEVRAVLAPSDISR